MIHVDLDAASQALICAVLVTLALAVIVEELTPLARRYAFEVVVSLGGLLSLIWFLVWLWRLR